MATKSGGRRPQPGRAKPSPAQPSPQHGWVSPPARHLTRSTDRNVLPQLTKNAPPQRVRG
jgi:hypothetical protein